MHFFDEGRGNRLPGVRETLGAAFNGVTELLDHRKTKQPPGQRLSSIWFGDNYRIKAKAFSLAQDKKQAWKNCFIASWLPCPRVDPSLWLGCLVEMDEIPIWKGGQGGFPPSRWIMDPE